MLKIRIIYRIQPLQRFSPLSAFLFSKTGKECRFFTNFGTSKEIEWRAKHNMFHLQRILDNYNAAKD